MTEVLIPKAEEIENVELQNIVAEFSKEYGEYVVMNRAVPDFRDGLKPVHRAILWSIYELRAFHNKGHVKTARVVGHVIGRYHSHGDASVSDAMKPMATDILPNLIDGKGNWGNHIEKAGAMRYTECRLSKFSEMYMLDPAYLAVVPKIENYDGTTEWPLFLPAKLPVQLLSGSSGIAYGVSQSTPSFKMEGVAKIVQMALKGQKITPQLCYKHLKINMRYGGICLSDEKDFLELFSTGKGRLLFRAETNVDKKKSSVYIESCAPGFSSFDTINKKLEKIANMDQVSNVSEQSGRGTGPYGIRYAIKIKKTSDILFNKIVKNIEQVVTGANNYEVSYTHRKKESTEFGRLSIVEFIEKWVIYRIAMEKAAIKYLHTQEQKKLEKQELYLWGTNHIDDIASALKDRKNGPVKHLQGKWKDKSIEFIQDIVALKVSQLSLMEQSQIKDKIKGIKEEMAVLKTDYKQPESRILRTFDADTKGYIQYAKRPSSRDRL